MRSRPSLRILAITCSAAFAWTLALGLPGRADDAPSNAVRHLTFDVTYNSESTIETKVSGLSDGSGDYSTTGVGSPSGTATNPGPSADRKGTISVDVVGATADGGLVVEVSQEHNGPPVRVGITPDSKLLSDRGVQLTEEEQTLLRFLTRGFVKSGTIAAGASWTAPSPDASITGHTTYKIATVDAASNVVSVDVNGAAFANGYNGFRETTSGTLKYDTAASVPLSFDISTRTELQSNGRLETIAAHIHSKLHDDSQGK